MKTPGAPIHRPIGVLYHDKNCPACGQSATPKGHDPCIADLPGVKYACCGHGVREGYIYFENGTVVRFFPTRIEQHDDDVQPKRRPWYIMKFRWIGRLGR